MKKIIILLFCLLIVASFALASNVKLTGWEAGPCYLFYGPNIKYFLNREDRVYTTGRSTIAEGVYSEYDVCMVGGFIGMGIYPSNPPEGGRTCDEAYPPQPPMDFVEGCTFDEEQDSITFTMGEGSLTLDEADIDGDGDFDKDDLDILINDYLYPWKESVMSGGNGPPNGGGVPEFNSIYSILIVIGASLILMVYLRKKYNK